MHCHQQPDDQGKPGVTYSVRLLSVLGLLCRTLNPDQVKTWFDAEASSVINLRSGFVVSFFLDAMIDGI